MAPSRKSLVYNYFTTQPDKSEKCNRCSTLITFVQAKNLEKHLQQHEDDWKDYQQAKEAAAELPSTPQSAKKKRKLDLNQPELSFSLSKKELSKNEINRLDRHAILIGAEPSLPLNIIKKHQKMLRPGYKAPGKDKLRSMIVDFSKKVLDRIKLDLMKTQSKCVTLDIWTDGNRSTYLGANLHTVDELFQSNAYFIGVFCMTNGTANQEVRSGIDFLLNRIGLQIYGIDYFVTDNGSNVKAAFKAESKASFVTIPSNEVALSNSSNNDEDNNSEDENDLSDLESEAESDSESADENETISELTEEVAFVDFQAILPKHLTCIDHSLELVLNRVIDKTFKASAIGIVILKARKLISRIRKSVQQKKAIYNETGYVPYGVQQFPVIAPIARKFFCLKQLLPQLKEVLAMPELQQMDANATLRRNCLMLDF